MTSLVDEQDLSNAALFPISLSNQAFSSENVLPLLPGLFEQYSTVLFLVADRLQIYNKALRLGSGVTLGGLITAFDLDQHYLEQRRKWISRLTAAIDSPVESFRWSVKGVEEFADAHCFTIFRNVMLAYYALVDFRRDVDAAATEHALARDDIYPLEQRQSLSKGYILEEIAISLRIHVVDRIRDEYYLGEQALPVLRLYEGCYGVRPEELAQIGTSLAGSRFFTRCGDARSGHWNLSTASTC